mgnify:CR=1 FL=1
MRNLDGLIDSDYTPFSEKGTSMIKLIILETIKLLITVSILYYTFKYETFLSPIMIGGIVVCFFLNNSIDNICVKPVLADMLSLTDNQIQTLNTILQLRTAGMTAVIIGLYFIQLMWLLLKDNLRRKIIIES